MSLLRFRFKSINRRIQEEEKKPRIVKSLLTSAKFFLLWLIPLTLLLGGVYIFLFSQFFIIDYVDVKNGQGIDASRIRTIIFSQMDEYYVKLIPQKNIYVFDEEAARKKIWDEYALDRLVIEKKLPKTLVVTIEGTPFIAAWLSRGKWYHLNAKGVIAREADAGVLPILATRLAISDRMENLVGKEEEGATSVEKKDAKETPAPSMPLIMDADQGEVKIGDALLAPEKLAFIVVVADKIKESGIEVLYFQTSGPSIDVRAVTKEGWVILFNGIEAPDRQIKNFEVVLKDKVKGDRSHLKYIDVRFDNRIYYKL